MRLLCRLGVHRWTNLQDIRRKETNAYYMLWQERKCQCCNKAHIREIMK